MGCCENHDRMDRVLTSAEFNDASCGTPTNPRGEQRFCCRQCAAHGQPLAMKPGWIGNVLLMAYLSDEERAQVEALAAEAKLPVADMIAGAGRANVTAAPSSGAMLPKA